MQKLKKSKTVYSAIVVDSSTGEVTNETTINRYPAEPPYVKMYLDKPQQIVKYSERLCVLTELAKQMTYSSRETAGNYVSINSPVGDKIMNELNIPKRTFRKIIADLVDAGCLRRVGRGQYQINPYLFGKGEWGDIARLRDSWTSP